MQNSEIQKQVATSKDPFDEITFSADDTTQGESSQNSVSDLLTQQQTMLDENSKQRENQEMPFGVLKVKPEEEFVNNIPKAKNKLKEANFDKFKKSVRSFFVQKENLLFVNTQKQPERSIKSWNESTITSPCLVQTIIATRKAEKLIS